jgi:hypothetical protein
MVWDADCELVPEGDCVCDDERVCVWVGVCDFVGDWEGTWVLVCVWLGVCVAEHVVLKPCTRKPVHGERGVQEPSNREMARGEASELNGVYGATVVSALWTSTPPDEDTTAAVTTYCEPTGEDVSMVHSGISATCLYSADVVSPRIAILWARAEPIGAPVEFDW